MGTVTLDQALERLMAVGGSDLLFSCGSKPRVRKDGKLELLEPHAAVLTPADTKTLIRELLGPTQWEELTARRNVDFSFTWRDKARIRGNAYYQRNSLAAAFRLLPLAIPSFDMLGIPESVHRLLERQHGLILVTGPTGSGKSTTQAAIIDHLNATRPFHIITIEDPIEYYHPHKKCVVTQREVGSDVPSFAEAIKRALRQDPDVILVGEMRDLETIETAITAAETGHLVLSTLHTLDATETINRIISVFPPHQQKQIRLQLSGVLKAVISMRLVPRADGHGRVPAVEVMITTPFIRDCIINKDKTKLIHEAIAAGVSQYGMQTFDLSIFQLYKKELISYDEALRRASNPDEFKLKIQGIQSTSDLAAEEMEKTMQSFDME